jgi:cholesterol oxidase
MRVAFTEEMKGFYARRAPAYDTGFVTGQRDWNRLMFRLTISTDDLGGVLADPHHRMTARGFVRCRELGATDLPVDGGTFSLFAPGSAPARLAMRYRLPFQTVHGPATLLGFKDVGNDGGPDAWSDTTTLFTRLVLAPDADFDHPEDDTFARGILRLNALMLGRQLTTFRGSPVGVARFLTFFAGRLLEVYGRRPVVEVKL